MANKEALTPKDLSFLRQYSLEFAFLIIQLTFSFQHVETDRQTDRQTDRDLNGLWCLLVSFGNSLHENLHSLVIVYEVGCIFYDEKLLQSWYALYTTLLPSVNTLALEMFRGAKYTHHAFMPIIKHLNYNSKQTSRSYINKIMKNPTDIKLCISHKNCLFTRSPS